MPPFPNLISDSILVNETIELLRTSGGQAPVVTVVDRVMNIASPAPALAKLLVEDLASTDPRIHVVEDNVELVEDRRYDIKLSETDFVVFDFETTGAKAPPCRVTEIGACRISNANITAEYQTLVDPETSIPEFITNLTGISNEMVNGAPRFREVTSEFLEFIGDAVLVAHNAMFDIRFLNHEIGLIHHNYKVANPYLCTVRLSRKLVPEIENHRLATVANYYSIDLTNHHRAADDARATAHIFLKLLELLSEKGVDALSDAVKCKF